MRTAGPDFRFRGLNPEIRFMHRRGDEWWPRGAGRTARHDTALEGRAQDIAWPWGRDKF